MLYQVIVSHVTVITSLAIPVTRLAIILWCQSSEAQEQMEDSRIRMQDGMSMKKIQP